MLDADGAFHFPLRFGFLLRLALVVQLFALGDTEFDLRSAVLEIDLQRHQREALLRRFAGKPVDLPAMQQQFPDTLWFVIEPIAHFVFGDFAADEPEFAAVEFGISSVEVAIARAETFHLRAHQGQPRLDAIEDFVFVKRLAIAADDLNAVGFGVGFLFGHKNVVRIRFAAATTSNY